MKERPPAFLPDIDGDELVKQAVIFAATVLAQLENNTTLSKRDVWACMTARDILERAEEFLFPEWKEQRAEMRRKAKAVQT